MTVFRLPDAAGQLLVKVRERFFFHVKVVCKNKTFLHILRLIRTCTRGYRQCGEPPVVYFEAVGFGKNGEQIDLRIKNKTEYRPWNSNLNGLVSHDEKETHPDADFYGAINLLAPRPIWRGCKQKQRRRRR